MSSSTSKRFLRDEVIGPECLIQWKRSWDPMIGFEFSESLHSIKRLYGRKLEADVPKVEVFNGSLMAWSEFSILHPTSIISPSVHSLHHPHTLQEDPLRDIVIIIIIKISPVLLCYLCVWVCTHESHPCRFCRWTTGRVEPWRAGTLCSSDEWCCPERVALRACLVQFGHIGYPVQWETPTHLYATNTCGL